MLYLVNVKKTNAPYRSHCVLLVAVDTELPKQIMERAAFTICEVFNYDPANVVANPPTALRELQVWAMPPSVVVAP